MYGHTRYRTQTSLADPSDFVLLTNHKVDYTDVFVGQGLYHNAPMVNWALEDDGACSWRVLGEQLERGDIPDLVHKVIEFNLSKDVRAAIPLASALSPTGPRAPSR